MSKVRVSDQVEAFARKLAPTPRRALRAGLAGLARDAGDRKALEDELAGFWRLRVGRLRVIYHHVAPNTVDCIFAEERKLVYEVFGALLRERLGG